MTALCTLNRNMKTFQILLEQVVNLQEEAYRKNTRRIDSLKNKLRKGIVKQVKGGKDEVVVKGFSLDSIFHAFNLYHDAGSYGSYGSSSSFL